jgi:hypothetical protein
LLQTCMLAQGLYVSTDSREPATGSLWGALMTELQKKVFRRWPSCKPAILINCNVCSYLFRSRC